jgi:predicted DNA-binding transcriptional regulator YafY
MEAFFGAAINVPIHIEVLEERKLKKKIKSPLSVVDDKSILVLGAAVNDKKILTFALDRIDKVTPLPEVKFIPCEQDLSERFADIVGVTLYEDRPLEHVVFWVSDSSKDYIITKPIHESQKHMKSNDLDVIMKKYPHLKNGDFFSIDCIPNYELIRELCSYGKELIVLEPSSIKDEIFNRISLMLEEYSLARR